MAEVMKSIEVNVPVETAYNQWTQFESFPQFMDGVESVEQSGDTHLHWRAKVGGNVQEWDAVITEQIPDDRIAWTSTDGASNAGVVTFHRIASDSCRVSLQMQYEPSGLTQSIGDMLGVVSRQIEGDLERFKTFIERQGVESGAWRGEVQRPESEGGKVPGMAGATTQTESGAYGNSGNDVSNGILGTNTDDDGVPAVGVGRSGTQGEAMDNIRGAASIGGSNH